MNFYTGMQQIEKQVVLTVNTDFHMHNKKFTCSTSFDDLGLDELDRCDLVIWAEGFFNIELDADEEEQLTTVGAFICRIWKEVRSDQV